MIVAPVRLLIFRGAFAVILASASIEANAQMKLHSAPPVIEDNQIKTKSSTSIESLQPSASGTKKKGKAKGQKIVTPRALEEGAIVVNKLKSVDPDTVGLVSLEQGGLPLNLWKGTDWKLVKALMRRTPVGPRSKVLRNLAKRVLITSAVVPVSKPENVSFIALRVGRLLAMGEIKDALSLLQTATTAREDQDLSKTRIEVLFYSNDNATGCKGVRDNVKKYTGIYWSQATAYCLALSGEHARAALIADLLRERAEDIEPIFFVAIDSLAGADEVDVPELNSPSALHIAMMRAAKLFIPEDFIRNADTAALRAIVSAPNTDLPTRLLAAEKALRFGVLSSEKLIHLYRRIPFSADELKRPFAAAETSWEPWTRALILRSAAAQRVPLAKAEILTQAWQIGRERRAFAEIVKASLPIVLSINPESQLNWFAIDAARALFGGGYLEEGFDWYKLVLNERGYDNVAKSAERALWHLAVLSDSELSVTISTKRLHQWFESEIEKDSEKGLVKALTFFSLLEALDINVSPKLWLKVLDVTLQSAEPQLNLAWHISLKHASRSKRVGETILLSIIGGGEVGSEEMALEDMTVVIRALKEVGLEREARALAIETAIANGL
ncbi:MAG: hypothetical protein VYB39_00140 [Pseudomonadota bacterium]|nr:hypothetical protein [Pseudomonadota bacterium]